MKNNITLIGMPSSGKSTVGDSLAKSLDMKFIDTDKIIFDKEKRNLRDIVNEDGLKAFIEIQESIVLKISVENCVIATGGSVVYGELSMKHLKDISSIIYLEIDQDDLLNRITSDRRFARNDGQSFQELYNERIPLYRKYSDITINCKDKEVDKIVKEIIENMNN